MSRPWDPNKILGDIDAILNYLVPTCFDECSETLKELIRSKGMSINPFLSFTAITNDVYCMWKCNNAFFSTSFDSVDSFDALHVLDDVKEKRKKMEKIGHALSIT